MLICSVNDNATGGDCTSIGTWNVASKTCTLTTDLTETIEIDSDGITLDGNGHTITGSNTGNGIYLSGRNGVTIKNTNVRNFFYGIYLYYSSNNTLSGNNANSNNGIGIHLYYSSSNTLSGNIASNNVYGIYLSYSGINTVYNNIFNNTNNFGFDGTTYSNNWNTTKEQGKNIVRGPYLGGNYWANPSGTGFSQTCADNNSDGICDSPYTLDSNNIDYLPLAHKPAITPALRGDVNRNGMRDTGDATLILRYIVELPIPSDYMPILPIGDMNCNGIIDTGDATLILRDIVSLDIPRCWE